MCRLSARGMKTQGTTAQFQAVPLCNHSLLSGQTPCHRHQRSVIFAAKHRGTMPPS
jgi:hypothetical protein